MAGFAQYFLFRNVKELSNYYILDPAAGSGTLLANIKARSVFGTDIHEFKYSLMRERGVRHFSEPVDFLKTQPGSYVGQLNEATNGDVVKKPLLVLSNPPYLGHSSPDDLEETLKAELKQFKMMSNDLCSFFMVQMTRLFNGDYNGLGEDLDGYIAVFSPTTWVNEDRGDQKEFREYILSQFSYEKGFRIDGSKFFDDMSSPVLFSLLKRRSKISHKKQDLLVDPSTILDLTREHALVSAVGTAWARMPDVVKSGFERVEAVLSKEEAGKFITSADKLLSKQTDMDLVRHIGALPKFSKCLKTSHSQTGNNDLSLSTDIIKKSTKVADICTDFKERLKLKISGEEIAAHLQLVYDDRPSIQTGYRFVYLDSDKFKTQSMPKIVGPALNFFEEVRKSHRCAKFYNAAPITTDIAVAQIPAERPVAFDKQSCGLKAMLKGSGEERYFNEFNSSIGDVRTLFFLRACMSHVPSFKRVASDKSIDSNLIWLPSLDGNSQALRELLVISFCHSVSTTRFEEIGLKYEGHQWEAVDYFSPLGWLKSSGMMKSIYEELTKSADADVKKACREAMSARLERKDFDGSTLIELAEERFAEAGFLPAEKRQRAG